MHWRASVGRGWPYCSDVSSSELGYQSQSMPAPQMDGVSLYCFMAGVFQPPKATQSEKDGLCA